MPRRIHRTTTPVTRARDEKLREQMKEWTEKRIRDFFTNPPPDRDNAAYFTAADVLSAIDDTRDVPAAWLRWHDDYATRYHTVRNTLERLARHGELEMGHTTNAKGLENSQAFRAPRVTLEIPPLSLPVAAAGWEVETHGKPSATEPIKRTLIEWLESNPGAFDGLDGIIITRTGAPRTQGTPGN